MDAVRPEPAYAELLVVSAAAAAAMIDAVRATGDDGWRCPVTSVEGAPTGSGRLRLGYRLALLRELEPARERRDGPTTPEELGRCVARGSRVPAVGTSDDRRLGRVLVVALSHQVRRRTLIRDSLQAGLAGLAGVRVRG